MREFYDEGWNDFINGKPYQGGTRDYYDGWHDCADATSENGPQEKI